MWKLQHLNLAIKKLGINTGQIILNDAYYKRRSVYTDFVGLISVKILTVLRCNYLLYLLYIDSSKIKANVIKTKSWSWVKSWCRHKRVIVKKTDCVRFPHKEIKYWVFSFLRSAVEAKVRRWDPLINTHTSRIRRKVGNEAF